MFEQSIEMFDFGFMIDECTCMFAILFHASSFPTFALEVRMIFSIPLDVFCKHKSELAVVYLVKKIASPSFSFCVFIILSMSRQMSTNASLT